VSEPPGHVRVGAILRPCVAVECCVIRATCRRRATFQANFKTSIDESGTVPQRFEHPSLPNGRMEPTQGSNGDDERALRGSTNVGTFVESILITVGLCIRGPSSSALDVVPQPFRLYTLYPKAGAPRGFGVSARWDQRYCVQTRTVTRPALRQTPLGALVCLRTQPC